MAEAAPEQSHRRVRMLGRDPNQSHRAATPLELASTAATRSGRVARGLRVGREERSEGRPHPRLGGQVRALAWSLIRARLSDRSFDNPDLPGRARVNNVYGMLS